MRYAFLTVLMMFVVVGCGGSDKPSAKPALEDAGGSVSNHPADAGAPSDAGSAVKDTGTSKPDGASSQLERPNTLPRPPRTGLPADLKPPR